MKLKNPFWQKRFKKRLSEAATRFTSSIEDDERLIPYDIISSIAHVRMLRRQKIISSGDGTKIEKALKRMLIDFNKGRFRLLPEYEDVHMNVEQHLQRMIGETSEKLHTARSRNDLVAADIRLYIRDMVLMIMERLNLVQSALLKKSFKNFGVVMPGYTHWQQAQPILASFYLLSYFYKFQRDFERLTNALTRINISPLGCCALAGTTLPIDSRYLARQLDFNRLINNALDGVGDRDFLCEVIYHFTQIMFHISSFVEELIVFSTDEFKLVELDDSLTTGSSIMPQKKNPDVCELLRAKAGKAIGNLTAVFTILKGIPSSYNRDLQELKHILFNQIDETAFSLEMMRDLIATLRFNKRKLDDWSKRENFICATDLVEYMVKKGYRFRDAYNIVAECVRESKGIVDRFIELCAGKLKVKTAVISVILKPENSVSLKRSFGGTGLKETKKSITKASKIVRSNRSYLKRLSGQLKIYKKSRGNL